MEIDGIKPAFVDKNGPAWHEADVLEIAAKAIAVNNRAEQDQASVGKMYQHSAKTLDESAALFKRSYDNFDKVATAVSEGAKKASGRIRSAAEDLSIGLARIEKQANFDRLERYVALLERAAQAMTLLAELEKSGKLEKISSALK